jgi:hypothetical protein
MGLETSGKSKTAAGLLSTSLTGVTFWFKVFGRLGGPDAFL